MNVGGNDQQAFRRVAVVCRHIRPSFALRPSQCKPSLCAGDDRKTLTAVRREGHQVPKDLQSRQGSAVVYMENPKAPAPSHAAKARTLVFGQSQGFLATTHHKLGVPYGTLINLAACPETGLPFTVISRLAEHTQNLLGSQRCSVLVTEKQGVADQLSVARCTLVGEMVQVEKTPARRNAFLEKHPTATYVDYDDFQCWQLRCESLRYIGGFGEMSWVEGSSYCEAAPDIVALGSKGAVEHMNEDHLDAVLAMTRAFGGLPQATSATMLSLDHLGFEVLALTPEGRRRTRVAFEAPLRDAEEIRPAVVALTQLARKVLGA
eukprot:TRINITY_DN29920_c0_g1_i1.p1 TRINITY_DN29920_c0_g1~~TRINITY_DN29920_c0_g1_i1.p1  ORF type:complete len:320 (+),score=46.76 TRINITY_DN29920_c0_g1_i1:88-1047(+)